MESSWVGHSAVDKTLVAEIAVRDILVVDNGKVVVMVDTPTQADLAFLWNFFISIYKFNKVWLHL